MSGQPITLVESTSSQPSVVPTTVGPSVGLGLIFLVLGGLVGWRLFRPQSNRLSTKTVSALDIAAAPEHCQDCLTGAPHFTQALQWAAAGKALEKQGQYEAAIALYREGLRDHPQDFRLWHEQGLALAKLERFEQALVCYDRAYALNPTQRDLAHERGDTLLQLKRYEAAITALEVFLRYDPQNAHVLSDHGYALYKLQRYPEALQSLNAALKSKVLDRDAARYAHYYQIATLQELGQLTTALKSSQVAIQSYPQTMFREQYEALRHYITQSLR